MDINYSHLHSAVKNDLEKWNLIPHLSLKARLEIIKMNVISRFLYLFQTLPITIPNHYFIDWDKDISRLIWKGKRPSICYKTLQLSKDKVGWGLPNLKNYFISTQI